jgi:uncharacterized protein YdaU (DUF1376 family)
MKNSIAFQYYPKDFLSDDKVASMNLKEIGAYWLLLSYCWMENGLKNDQDYLKGLCRNDAEWEKIWNKICKCFFLKNAKLRNRRLDEERKKQKEFRQKLTESGKIGAEKRWGGHEKKIGKPFSKNGVAIQKNASPISNLQSPNNKNKILIKDIIEKEFSDFWEAYPVKLKKNDAEKAFRALRKKIDLETIVKAFNGYIDFLKDKRLKENFPQTPMYPATFLREERWKDYLDFQYKPSL